MLTNEFRTPWFEIIEVVEPRGRSMADIAKEAADRCKVSLREMRSPLAYDYIVKARSEAYRSIRIERPDISTERIARFFNKEGSTVRYHCRKLGLHKARAA